MNIDYFDYFIRFKKQVDNVVVLNYTCDNKSIVNKVTELINKVNAKKTNKFLLKVEKNILNITLSIYEGYKSTELYKFEIDIVGVKRNIKLNKIIQNNNSNKQNKTTE